MAPKSYGRTLVELITVVAILSIISTMALPNLQDLRDANTRTQAVNQMLAFLHHARSSAVFNRQITTLCSGPARCSNSAPWREALMVFIDKNANGQLDANEVLLYQANIAEDFFWYWNRSKGHIQFEADGTTRAMNGTLTLCRKGIAEHQVVIALAGRVRSQRPGREAKC
ncbi:MAG: GspH/FimT family pseudopilin [Pseudomonas sp.]|nr:GspH/FimT family pseudopilin [Pseudomonas sp.]